jgi:hypothetical protein
MKKRHIEKYWMKRGKEKEMCCHKYSACGQGIYFLGFIGAAIYYIQQAAGFWEGVLGVLKAVLWPAFLAYKLFVG